MVKGRKPKPTHLRVIEGNRGKRDLPQNEPTPRSAYPDKPDFTSDAAAECWDRTVVELKAMHILHSADRDALQVYCETFGVWVTAQSVVDEEGLMVERREGWVSHPAWRAARDAATLVKSLGEAFGLTPAARSRIELPDVDHDPGDLFDKPG